MADKTKSDFPPDAIPRRYQANLVPPSAAGVPDPIREASEQLRVSALAAERAFTERRSAEAAAKAAPRLDSQAGIEAVKRGEDPPPATAPEREREAEVARQRERAQNAIAQTASIALERAIREHCGGWVEPQRSDAVAIAQEALADVDALEAQLERLAASAGSSQACKPCRWDGSSSTAGCSSRALSGSTRRTAPNPTPPAWLLAELREAIATTVPDPVPVDGPLMEEQESFGRMQRAYRQMAAGGVAIPDKAA